MADLDLQIVVGVGAGRGGYPDPEITGGSSQKDFFRTFGPKFGLKIRGAGTPPPRAPPLDPPLLSDSLVVLLSCNLFILIYFFLLHE